MNFTRYFPDNPRKIVKIDLPSGIHPGLGHTFLSICGIMSYCSIKDYYPVLNDQNWIYGKWTDFFDVFNNDEKKIQELMGNNMPIFTPHVGNIEFCLFFAVQNIHRKFYKEIFIPKIIYNTDDFKNIDVAIHVRQGDRQDYLKNNIEETLEKTKKFIKNIEEVKRMFVMTDERSVIEAFQRNFACEILTLCPNTYNGDPSNIRHAENIHLFLREVQIAKNAKYFIGSAFSQASMVVDIARDGYQVFYI